MPCLSCLTLVQICESCKGAVLMACPFNGKRAKGQECKRAIFSSEREYNGENYPKRLDTGAERSIMRLDTHIISRERWRDECRIHAWVARTAHDCRKAISASSARK